ncbi:hypothetical protein TRVL_09083 [Trypanosoma vivax]|nr:hypothetical protein TRVL_09083 [Trypanosoma vivax]
MSCAARISLLLACLSCGIQSCIGADIESVSDGGHEIFTREINKTHRSWGHSTSTRLSAGESSCSLGPQSSANRRVLQAPLNSGAGTDRCSLVRSIYNMLLVMGPSAIRVIPSPLNNEFSTALRCGCVDLRQWAVGHTPVHVRTFKNNPPQGTLTYAVEGPIWPDILLGLLSVSAACCMVVFSILTWAFLSLHKKRVNDCENNTRDG